jgi:glycosyltransferase involved in cell wall biosynthesis
MPKVSIIVPIYNAEEYLSICLDSIVSQSYKNIEIIAVDDKSTDNSLGLLNKYKEKHNYLKIKKVGKNSGVSHARNVGFDVCTGDYIFFIDSDDFIDKDAIEKLVYIAMHENADVVDTERLYWYKKGSKLLTFTEKKQLKDHFSIGNIHNDIRSIVMPRYVTGKLYKKEVIGNIRFDENIRCYEDALFNHQIKDKFTNYVYAKHVFYHYLQRPSSLINTISTNHLDYIYASQKIKDIYEVNNYFNEDIKHLVDNIIINDIIVIMAVKIPKMKLSKDDKKKYINDYLNLINKLGIKDKSKKTKLVVSLFKYKAFISTYFAITKHLNIIDLGFQFLNILHPYRLKDEKLKHKVLKIYENMYKNTK